MNLLCGFFPALRCLRKPGGYRPSACPAGTARPPPSPCPSQGCPLSGTGHSPRWIFFPEKPSDSSLSLSGWALLLRPERKNKKNTYFCYLKLTFNFKSYKKALYEEKHNGAGNNRGRKKSGGIWISTAFAPRDPSPGSIIRRGDILPGHCPSSENEGLRNVLP